MSFEELVPESSYIVRFSDCDPFGHLNNARYIDYFINAREDHLRDTYDMDLADYAKEGLGWVVSGHDIVYVRPANYNERIVIRSSLIAMDANRLWVEMTMLNAEGTQLKAMLWSRFTPIDVRTGRRCEHPDSFIDSFKRLVLPQAAPGESLQERASRLAKALKAAEPAA
ncbi:acyl-CoA thioesterase [Luteibacter yeojuensis]|uniref:Acyl-CoA thioesterase n=1 Tax=Luteibacter yeojuensis TaxID=345309 RepID=A0A7X5QTH9_9GAMM|nr:acyl-CoA thioesterase [Luteibacter yeojuensis]NID15143.1 acyl-CoA thioesterase [Luteibacter yeojuensis]